MLCLEPDQGGHELCADPQKCVCEFFDDALNTLDEARVCEIMNEERRNNPRLPICPPKAIVQADRAWCEKIKQGILNLC